MIASNDKNNKLSSLVKRKTRKRNKCLKCHSGEWPIWLFCTEKGLLILRDEHNRIYYNNPHTHTRTHFFSNFTQRILQGKLLLTLDPDWTKSVCEFAQWIFSRSHHNTRMVILWTLFWSCHSKLKGIHFNYWHLISPRIPNLKIVKNVSLVMLDCIFTMYSARVYSISQWEIYVKRKRASPPGQFLALQAINALKGTISP